MEGFIKSIKKTFSILTFKLYCLLFILFNHKISVLKMITDGPQVLIKIFLSINLFMVEMHTTFKVKDHKYFHLGKNLLIGNTVCDVLGKKNIG